MEISYRFESSNDVKKISHDGHSISLKTLIHRVLADIFKDTTPSCCIEAVNVTDGTVDRKTDMPIVFKRTYKKLFEVKIPTPKAKTPQPRKRLKRRWRARSPVKKRWRSRSPKRYVRW